MKALKLGGMAWFVDRELSGKNLMERNLIGLRSQTYGRNSL